MLDQPLLSLKSGLEITNRISDPWFPNGYSTVIFELKASYNLNSWGANLANRWN